MLDKQLEMWSWIASVYGWNELAKHAETLGEKVFFRTMRSTAQKQLDQYGVKVPYTADNPVVLEIPYGQLNLEFRESDYELMRKALVEHARAPESNDLNVGYQAARDAMERRK